ncbi:hypothetical protein [Rhizobium terrae]|uniref:hypothetical protein n=1 Tax=Rhizobium terrae TaxID=2171756 RepID=UPI000E3D0D4A|nr:hypothetical protein [Rhizobium terrae]
MDQDDKDRGYWLGWWFAYGTLGLLFILAVWNSQFDDLCTASEPAWLPWAQPEEHCFREWISALSGWVGFGAAAIGAYFVYHQLNEQRKQTAFILGDGNPSVEVYTYSMNCRRAVFRIINWNRRTLTLRKISFGDGSNFPWRPAGIRYFEGPTNFEPHRGVRRKSIGVDFRGGAEHDRLEYACAIDGWLNRAGSPFYIDIEVYFKPSGEDFTDVFNSKNENTLIDVLFHCWFDETGQAVPLKTSLALIDFLPNFIKANRAIARRTSK